MPECLNTCWGAAGQIRNAHFVPLLPFPPTSCSLRENVIESRLENISTTPIQASYTIFLLLPERPTLILQLYHVRLYSSHHSFLRRQAPQACSQCLHHGLRNEIQSLPPSPSRYQQTLQGPFTDLPVWPYLYCRKLFRERFLPAPCQPKRNRRPLP